MGEHLPKGRFRKPLSPNLLGPFTLGRIERVDYTEHTQLKPSQDMLTPAPQPLPPAVGEGRTEMEVEHVEMLEQGEVEVEEPARAPTSQPVEPQPLPVNLRPYKNPNLKIADPSTAQKVQVTSETVVHPELNIIKHADFIFSPSHARDLHKPRTKTWVTVLNGRKLKSSLLVDPFRGKRLTTRTFKVFLALQHLLECKGWDSQERVLFSYRELAASLGWKWLGKRTIKELDAELDQLRGTLFTWKHSFVGEDRQVYTLLERVTILDKLATLRREDRAKEELFQDINVFRYDETIRKTLKANLTKPTYLLTALTIEGEIPLLLYTRLDLFLANTDRYERTSEGVFRDLRLISDDLKSEKKYRYPDRRKRKLKEWVSRIQGKPLSSGGTLHVTLKKTKDGKDWKLVAKRVVTLKEKKQKPNLLATQVKPTSSPNPEAVAEPEPHANPEEDIPRFQDQMENTLGIKPGIYRLYFRWILMHYPYQGLVDHALVTWKETDHGAEKDEERVETFKVTLHRLAHLQSLPWLQKEECLKDCQYLLRG